MSTEIGRIDKNKNTKIVIRMSKFKGMQLCDVREYIESDQYTGFTKKGISIRKDKIEELIELLNQAKDIEELEEDEYKGEEK